MKENENVKILVSLALAKMHQIFYLIKGTAFMRIVYALGYTLI